MADAPKLYHVTLTANAETPEVAGLPPRDELRIDVVPAPPLPQSSVSPQLSDSVPGEFPGFGGRPDPG